MNRLLKKQKPKLLDGKKNTPSKLSLEAAASEETPAA
jgi:hypothetical protein